MAISAQYGMGTYNARLPSSNIRLPQTAGGVSTPLAFFPSSSRGDIDAALDTSLQDLIDAAGGTNTAENTESTSSYGGFSGLGASPGVATAVGVAISAATGLLGAPAAVGSIAGGVGKGIAGKGMTDQDMANLAISTIATALGVPGVAMAGLGRLGFNPAQGLAEALGISDVTPGYEGGFFGTAGLGSGLRGGISSDVSGTPSGFSEGDLGGGIGTDSSPSSDTPAGFGAGDLGSGLRGSISAAGFGGYSGGDIGDSNSDSNSDTSSKVVCTAMNLTYGFGAYRNAIWLKYSKKYMSEYHQVGYHLIFIPLVARAYYRERPNLTLRKLLEHIARHRTADLRAVMYDSRRDLIGAAYRIILEPLCYVVGFCKSKINSAVSTTVN